LWTLFGADGNIQLHGNGNQAETYVDHIPQRFAVVYGRPEFSAGYHRLSAYKPPVFNATNYSYYDVDWMGLGPVRVAGVDTSFDGRIEYQYANHSFYFNGDHELKTRVLSEKKMRDSASSSFATWTYEYPD